MKKLIAIGTLGLALGFSSLSFALDHMELYTKSEAKSDVKDEIKGGRVERDFMGFYINPRPASTQTQLVSDHSTDEEYTTVFGVRVAL